MWLSHKELELVAAFPVQLNVLNYRGLNEHLLNLLAEVNTKRQTTARE